jgi:hypothetical protein
LSGSILGFGIEIPPASDDSSAERALSTPIPACYDPTNGHDRLVYHPAYLDHDMGAGHPESPNRLRAILQQLERSGTAGRIRKIEPRKAEDEWITQIHSPSYVAALTTHQPSSGRVALDGDTSMSPGSLQAAYLAAGGALAAVDAIMRGDVEHAFCAVRPPVTMRKPTGRWVFVFSTTWLSRRATFKNNTVWAACSRRLGCASRKRYAA